MAVATSTISAVNRHSTIGAVPIFVPHRLLGIAAATASLASWTISLAHSMEVGNIFGFLAGDTHLQCHHQILPCCQWQRSS